MAEETTTTEIPFASSDAEAKVRAGNHYDNDPLVPAVAPSLLSSADISRYVRATGMLYPFDESKLKTASYEVRPRGQFIYWRIENGRVIPVEETITDNTTSITFPANSISYIQAEPQFRLPLYIAIRFNLRIKHVHRGILLGTGPIVDPGFSGKLLIPIHNLTSTDYVLNLVPKDEDDGLIWVEFTRTTYVHDPSNKKWTFDEKKKDKSPRQYLREANGSGNPILSSIHDGIESAKVSAKSAENTAKQIRNIAIVAGVTIVIAVCSLIVSTLNTVNGSLALTNTTKQNMLSLVSQTQKDRQDLDAVKKTLAIETTKSQAFAATIAALELRIGKLEATNQAKTRGR